MLPKIRMFLWFTWESEAEKGGKALNQCSYLAAGKQNSSSQVLCGTGGNGWDVYSPVLAQLELPKEVPGMAGGLRDVDITEVSLLAEQFVN